MDEQTVSRATPATEQAFYRQPLMSFHGVKKSYRYLDLFIFHYSQIYGCEPREFLALYAPYVTLIESLVYQADVELEEAQRKQRAFADIATWVEKKTAILSLLQEVGFVDATFTGLLENLSEYWALENEINYRKQITPASLKRAIALRASDFHATHYLCLRLANPPHWEAIFAALVPLAILFDLQADLGHYEKDVKKGDYNCYRAFIKVYRESGPARMQEEMNYYQDLLEQKLAHLPSAVSANFRRVVDEIRDRYPTAAMPSPIFE